MIFKLVKYLIDKKYNKELNKYLSNKSLLVSKQSNKLNLNLY